MSQIFKTKKGLEYLETINEKTIDFVLTDPPSLSGKKNRLN